eukprot:5795090-Ditylum_brightwellii.AAC.1
MVVQISVLKEQLKKLNARRRDVTVMLLDIENMHPSIRLRLIRNMLDYYLRNLLDTDKKTIKDCLGIIKFGMKSTLV